MNWLKRSLLVVAGMLSFCGSDAPAADAPVKVYILAGQSNMQGHAKVSTLAYMAEDPATAGLLSQMQDGEGGFRTVENTWISYLTQGRGPASG